MKLKFGVTADTARGKRSCSQSHGPNMVACSRQACPFFQRRRGIWIELEAHTKRSEADDGRRSSGCAVEPRECALSRGVQPQTH